MKVLEHGRPAERGLTTMIITVLSVAAFVAVGVQGNGPGDDCNGNGFVDSGEIDSGQAEDCNGNGVPDDCDIDLGNSEDCNFNRLPDECEDLGQRGLVGTYTGTFLGSGGNAPVLDNFPIGENPLAVSLARIDSRVDFDWGNGAPWPGFDNDGFYVTWTGYVETPSVSGTYTFFGRSDDGMRIWVNGELVVDNFVRQAASEASGTIDLDGDSVYRIRVEYFEWIGQSVAELRWQRPGGNKVIIPTQRLLPYLDCNNNGIADDCDIKEAQRYSVSDQEGDAGVRSEGTHMAWMNQFTVQEGLSTITHMDIAFGSSAIGQPATLYIWADANNDGDPNDATVLAAESIVIPSGADSPDGLTRFDIPDINVGADGTSCFAGVIMDVALGGSDFPAAGDLDEPTFPGRSWIVGSTAAIDPNDLTANAVEFGTFEGVGLPPGNWNVRPIHAGIGDCNGNLIPDECDIANGTSLDDNGNGIPDECEADCPGDTDDDGDVDLTDLANVLGDFGQTGAGIGGDVNDDGLVDLTDLAIVLANFGVNCN